jgi:RimJ/RimL family protein N-acetyltransferase
MTQNKQTLSITNALRFPRMLTDGRIALRPLSGSDSAALFGYRSLPEVTRFQPWQPVSVADVDAFIGQYSPTGKMKLDSWWQIGIYLTHNGILIGDLGICPRAAETEIGFTLNPAYAGNGYARMAVNLLLDFARNRLQTPQIIARTAPANDRSINLLQKCGFRKEGVIPSGSFVNGKWCDDVIFIRKFISA